MGVAIYFFPSFSAELQIYYIIALIFIIHLAMLRLTLATYDGAASLDTRLSLSYQSVFPEVTWNFPTKLNLSAQPSTPKTTLSPIEPLYSA